MQFIATLQGLFGWLWRTIRDDRSSSSLPIRILTHNIRYATSDHAKNEKPWQERLPLIMSQLSYHTRSYDWRDGADVGAGFICMQEVLHSQLYDVLSALNQIEESDESSSGDLPDGPYWAHVGVARENGKTKGEYSPIVYLTKLFNLLHFENLWLSPTPHKPSKGWDAGSERILTTAVFEHKRTKRRLAAFNTHLDNAGPMSRKKSILVIVEQIVYITRRWSPKGNPERLGFFLAGDFNSFPTQEAYRMMMMSELVIDVHDTIPMEARYGDEVTFTGFQPDTDVYKDEIGRIDFVFVGPKAKDEAEGRQVTKKHEVFDRWKIQGYSVLPNVFDDGVFCSDHRCVVADVVVLHH